MRALRFEKAGSLDHLRLVNIPRPVPVSEQVLVEVRAAGLNPSDVKNVLGRFPYTTLPRTPGRDFAGVVVEGPSTLKGHKVWGTGKEIGFTQDGSHAAFLAVAVTGVAPMPAHLSFEQAAACGVPYCTAWDALERTDVKEGTRVLVIGAGSVGAAALALSRWRKANTLVAVRRAEQAKTLAASGTKAAVLNASTPVMEITQSHFAQGAEVIFDTTGMWLHAAVGALSPFGRIAIIAAPPNGQVDLSTLALYRRGGSIVGVNSLLYDSTACARMLARIGEGFDTGGLPPPACSPRPFADAIAAYRAGNSGLSAKIVFTNLS